MMVALYWNHLRGPFDYLPEFSLRYDVDIQRHLTRLVAVPAMGFGSAQTETAYALADAAMLWLWPVGLKSVVHHYKRLRFQYQNETVGLLVAN